MLKAFLCCAVVAATHAALLGGYKQVDSKDEDAQKVINFAETSLNARNNGIYLRRITKVLSVRRQLVNGFNYEIEFMNGLTKCTRQHAQDLSGCEMYDDKDQKCVVRVYQSFSGEKQMNDFKCQNAEGMVKRAGGITKVDNPQKYAETALRALAMSNSVLRNIEVVSAKTQVVAGQKIMLEVVGDSSMKKDTRCKVDVWSRPWLQGDEAFKVTHFSCEENVQRRALLGGVTGGISQSLDNKAEFLDTARKALSMTNTALTDLEVVDAKTQVVAGMKYFLTVRGKEFGTVKECKLEVWSRPWLSSSEAFKLTHFKCSNPSSKRSMKLGGKICAGCVSDKVTNPNDYMDLYIRAFGLAKTNMDVNNIKILSVKTQVVAGTKYYMKVRTSEAGEPRECDVQFVVAPWMTPDMTIVKFDCKPVDQ